MKLTDILVLVALALALPLPFGLAVPVITEFMADNCRTLEDEEGDASDWIEVYNPSTDAVDLSGSYLTDDALLKTKWAFPAGTLLEGNQHLLVFASGKNRTTAGEPLHTNFTLAKTGEYLGLIAADGVAAWSEFSPAYPAQREDVSFGIQREIQHPVDAQATLKVLVPQDGSMGLSWNGSNEPFNDAAWTSGTNGVGYEAFPAMSPDFNSSTSFSAQYDGDEIWNAGFLNGWTESGGAGTVESLSGTALRYDHSSSGIATVLDGTFTGWNTGNNGDWTVEIRLRLHAAPNGFRLWLGTDSQRIFVDIFEDRTENGSGNTFSVQHDNLDSAFHTFRVAHDSAGSVYHVWRDNQTLTPVDGVPYDAIASDSRLLFGDFSSGSFGNSFDVDIGYVRYDQTGAYSPLLLPIFSVLIHTDVSTVMTNQQASCYVRIPFEITGDPAGGDDLQLDIHADDGFVAYLNGVEIARRNAPTNPEWNDTAVTNRIDQLALDGETFSANAKLSALVAGTNVLAFHGLNDAVDAWRFLVQPTLIMSGLTTTYVYYKEATPEALNLTPGGSLPAPPLDFSLPSQLFTNSVSLTITSEVAGAEIRYTLDGSDPTSSATAEVYTSPLVITSSVEVLSMMRATGYQDSAVRGRRFTEIGSDLLAFSSPLPVVLIGNQGAGPIPAKNVISNPLVIPPGNDGGGIQQVPRQSLLMGIYEPAAGITELNRSADLATRSGMRVRGSSSSSLAKKSFSVEAWDEEDKPTNINPFGLPCESDWVLYAPTETFSANRYDRPLIHNTFIYELSNQMGRYAPRTQFVEVLINTDGDELTMADYAGMYVWMEKIKRDNDRVDFDKMAWDATSGGWMLNIGRMDSLPVDDPDAVPQHFHTPGLNGLPEAIPNDDHGIRPVGGLPDDRPENYAAFFNFDSPQGYKINSTQRQVVENQVLAFETALYSPNYTNQLTGYATHIDVVSFIDQFICHNLAKNQDALLLSSSIYSTGPGAMIQAGPIWDFDRGYTTSSAGTDPATQLAWPAHRMWYPRLFSDAEFNQQYIDRWQTLRKDELSTNNLLAIVDGQTNEITSAVALRNGTLSWETKVAEMKTWLASRAAALDAQFVAPPAFSLPGGHVAAGTTITLSAPAGTIYYTTDGTDPRVFGGSVAPQAMSYSAGIVINTTMSLTARVRANGEWSGPCTYTFIVGAVSAAAENIVVSEIMYRPTSSSAQEDSNGYTSRKDFEYVELMNIGASPVDLGHVSFTLAITYTFPMGTVLPVGGRTLVEKKLAGFNFRYAAKMPGPIAGVFAGSLANEGETLTLLDSAGGVIKSFRYENQAPWPIHAFDAGHSLMLVDPYANPDHGEPESWRSSVHAQGCPGASDGSPFIGDRLGGSDVDMDGSPASLEYVFGTSDTNSASVGHLKIDRPTPKASLVQLRFPVNPALTGVSLLLQDSTNLVTWLPSNALYGGEAYGSSNTVWRVYTLPDTPPKYLRLRIDFP